MDFIHGNFTVDRYSTILMVANNLWGRRNNFNWKQLRAFSWMESIVWQSWMHFFCDLRKWSIVVMNHNENTLNSVERNKAISLCKKSIRTKYIKGTFAPIEQPDLFLGGDETLLLVVILQFYYGPRRCHCQCN